MGWRWWRRGAVRPSQHRPLPRTGERYGRPHRALLRRRLRPLRPRVLLLHQAAVADGAGDLEDTSLAVTAFKDGASGGTLASITVQLDEVRASARNWRIVSRSIGASTDHLCGSPTGSKPTSPVNTDSTFIMRTPRLRWRRQAADGRVRRLGERSPIQLRPVCFRRFRRWASTIQSSFDRRCSIGALSSMRSSARARNARRVAP